MDATNSMGISNSSIALATAGTSAMAERPAAAGT